MSAAKARVQANLLKRREEKRKALEDAKKKPKGGDDGGDDEDAEGDDVQPERKPATGKKSTRTAEEEEVDRQRDLEKTREEEQARTKLADRKKLLDEAERIKREAEQAERKRIEEETRKKKEEQERKWKEEEDARKKWEAEERARREAEEKDRRENVWVKCTLPGGDAITLKFPLKYSIEQVKNGLIKDLPPKFRKNIYFIQIEDTVLEYEFHKFGEPPIHPAISKAIEDYKAVEVTLISDLDVKNMKKGLKPAAKLTAGDGDSKDKGAIAQRLAQQKADQDAKDAARAEEAARRKSVFQQQEADRLRKMKEKEEEIERKIQERKRKEEEDRLAREREEKIRAREQRHQQM